MHNNNWTINGDEVRVNIPFAKVNKERRTVSGFATLDNVDTHGDIIEADASVTAFKRFRGNLREMHQPVAVGKMVDFVPQEFEDPESGDVYKGIFVTAYISKGAQDTWEKVLDGTLSGFSVGGAIKKKEASKDVAGASIIKEYDLFELSLVDNPANPLANVFSVQKLGDTMVASGMAVETKVLNILYSKSDDLVILSDKEEKDGFDNIGWVEDTEESAEKIKKTVEEYKEKSLQGSMEHRIDRVRQAWYKTNKSSGENSYQYVLSVFDDFVVTQDEEGAYYRYSYSANGDDFEFGVAEPIEVRLEIAEKSAQGNGWKVLSNGDAEFTNNNVQSSETSGLKKENEGGANVATEQENNEETVEEVEQEETVEETDDTTEKAADINEGPTADVDVDAIVKAVSESVTKTVTEVAEKSANSVKEAQDSFNEALEAVKKEISDLSTKVDGVDARVTTVEGGTAVKKSADDLKDDDSAEESDKDESFWRGGFLGTNNLVK